MQGMRIISQNKERIFDAMHMAIYQGYISAARFVFYDAIMLAREEIIKDCIELAIKKGAHRLAKDIEKMK